MSSNSSDQSLKSRNTIVVYKEKLSHCIVLGSASVNKTVLKAIIQTSLKSSLLNFILYTLKSDDEIS